jgi:hypothetical protein
MEGRAGLPKRNWYLSTRCQPPPRDRNPVTCGPVESRPSFFDGQADRPISYACSLRSRKLLRGVVQQLRGSLRLEHAELTEFSAGRNATAVLYPMVSSPGSHSATFAGNQMRTAALRWAGLVVQKMEVRYTAQPRQYDLIKPLCVRTVELFGLLDFSFKIRV